MPETDPYWWDEAGPPSAPAKTDLPAEVDVLVIGAGLTGLSAALTLARAGKSVLALDAGPPGGGASARNGGMIGGGHRMALDEIDARFGPDLATRILSESHLESLAFARRLIAEEGIACDFAETGRFRGLWRTDAYDLTARELGRLQDRIPLEAEMVPRARQHDEVASDLYRGGVVYRRHGGLNPAKYVAGLAKAATRAGATVQGQTPVLSLAEERGGHLAETPRGPVRAGAVLAATNGYTPACLPALRRRIVPIPSFIVATEPLGENRLRSLFPSGRMVVEARERHCYYRPSPCFTRLVFGGRAALFDAPPRLVERELAGLIAEIFPDLRGVRLSHAWRGRTGFSFEAMPHVGRIGGIWHAMGFSGSGNAMAPWLGHKAALGILGDPERETAFAHTPFPTRAWYRGQPWFLPLADAMFRLRDLRADWRRGR